jgi:hypothetical protein
MPTLSLPGFKTLLEGPTGTGKTYSIGTLVDAGLEVFYLGIGEGAGIESLIGYWTDAGKAVPANFHYAMVEAPDYGFDQMMRTLDDISRMTNDALTKIQDPNKSKHNQFILLFRQLNDFVDQFGKHFGPVDKWDTSRVLVIDALTGINSAAMSLVVGGKPIKSLVDWGVAMDQIEKLLRKLTDGCKCHFVLISHVEREVDQVLGGVKITTGTLGNKLASKIPPMFSDVILAYRQGTNFYWSTANAQADLKARNLPIAEGIRPDFSQIVTKWKSRAGVK